MQLIHALASGVVGAENGSVRIYRRGTSTRATIYSDFEASTADSSGADIALDATGGAVVYVNELVQVQIYDELGELVRDFVAGGGAYAIEAISPAFTGTDYDSGATGASKPTTVGAILDLWLASSGAIDWKVLFSGAAANLQDALGSIFGLFYNVKSPEFGAVGDGSEDDVAAWQAAHDAAAAAGGGVVVAPPGIYNISTQLTWKTGVHLLCIPDSVMLRQTTAATVCLSISDSVANATLSAGMPTYVLGCAFDSTVTNSATQLTIAHSTVDEVIVESCKFLCSAFATGAGIVMANTAGRVQVRNSNFVARAAVKLIYDTRASASTRALWVHGCDFSSWAGNAYGTSMVQSDGAELRVTGTKFYYQSTSGNTFAIYMTDTDNPLIVDDCHFLSGVSGDTAYAVQLAANVRAFVGEGNAFRPGINLYYQAAATDIAAEGISSLYLRREGNGSTTGVTATVTDYYETFFISSTNVAAPTVTLPKALFYGQKLFLIVQNNSAANWGATTVALAAPAGTGVLYDTSGPNLVTGHATGAVFTVINRSGSIRWIQTSEWVDAL